ncbi:MAG: polyprenyl synthetase family protein [Deltaproteobacteria bacterium]|nr:polyprenyl synthetase family protein [Deltaproteobacteria bacterium]
MTTLSLAPPPPVVLVAVDRAATLVAVEERLRAVLGGSAGKGLTATAAAHLVLAPAAHRARPRLMLAFAALAAPRGVNVDRLIAMACAVELIHSASLLHDDVVDGADQRRGRPSVNATHGNAAAVLVGDQVLATALQLLSFDVRAMRAAVDVVAAMSVAAVREVEVRADAGVDVATLAEVADGKTAALFGLCGTFAGLLADDDDAGARLCGAARALGLAFQLADDADDVVNDLVERTPTGPIARACLDPMISLALHALWSAPLIDVESARGLASAMKSGTAIPAIQKQVRELIDSALDALAPWQGLDGHDDVAAFAARVARF